MKVVQRWRRACVLKVGVYVTYILRREQILFFSFKLPVRRQYICSSGFVVKCCWYLPLKNHSLID